MAECSLNLDRTTASGKGCFESIAPLLQLFVPLQPPKFPLLLPDGERAWTLTEGAAWCAKQNNLSVRTIWRKISKFKESMSGAPQRVGRKDKGVSRFFAKHEQGASFAAYLHLLLKPACGVVHRAILRHSLSLGITEPKTPSCETVRLWLRSTPRAMLIERAIEGQRLYRELMFSDLECGLLSIAKDRSE